MNQIIDYILLKKEDPTDRIYTWDRGPDREIKIPFGSILHLRNGEKIQVEPTIDIYNEYNSLLLSTVSNHLDIITITHNDVPLFIRKNISNNEKNEIRMLARLPILDSSVMITYDDPSIKTYVADDLPIQVENVPKAKALLPKISMLPLHAMALLRNGKAYRVTMRHRQLIVYDNTHIINDYDDEFKSTSDSNYDIMYIVEVTKTNALNFHYVNIELANNDISIHTLLYLVNPRDFRYKTKKDIVTIIIEKSKYTITITHKIEHPFLSKGWSEFANYTTLRGMLR